MAFIIYSLRNRQIQPITDTKMRDKKGALVGKAGRCQMTADVKQSRTSDLSSSDPGNCFN